jgi:hypothetical protein
MLRKRIRTVEPPADRDRTAERAPTSASGSAVVTSALRAAMTTAVAVIAVVTAVVDGNAA